MSSCSWIRSGFRSAGMEPVGLPPDRPPGLGGRRTYVRAAMENLILTRRELLCRSGMGMGALALGSLMAEAGLLGRAARGAEGTPAGTSPPLAVNPLAPKAPP